MTTLTNEQLINSLKAKSKMGWKCYFIERDKIYDIQQTVSPMIQVVEQLKSNKPIEYDHLKKMFLELYDKVGELCNCPVCYEQMTKDITEVPLCGHLICKECKTKLTSCPYCRKSYK